MTPLQAYIKALEKADPNSDELRLALEIESVRDKLAETNDVSQCWKLPETEKAFDLRLVEVPK